MLELSNLFYWFLLRPSPIERKGIHAPKTYPNQHTVTSVMIQAKR